MSAPVDVRAVMELARADASASGFWQWHDQLAEALAAVTELVEADKEFDKASAELARNARTPERFDSARRLDLARVRRAAALARCGAVK